MRATLEPLDLDRDLPLVHAWVTHPRSAYWQMLDATREQVAQEYAAIAAEPHHDAWLGRVDGEPTFLAETYDPARSPLAGLVGVPELRPGDRGMHLLVGPPAAEPVPGLTRTVFAAVMAHCFADPAVARVVVEPDVRNRAIAALNAEAGFVVLRELDLPAKTAALSVCTREAFAASPLHARAPEVP